jgi:exodeoxyribonuclease V alpha subunit
MNRGGVGARSLNIELQAALNPAGERKVERFGWTFAPGDRIMQIENDYDKEVYNGDIGYVKDVDPDEGELTAIFDGRSVVYGLRLMTQHFTMLQRNLLYTGVTRGKRLVVLCGPEESRRYRGTQRLGAAPLVEAVRVVTLAYFRRRQDTM